MIPVTIVDSDVFVTAMTGGDLGLTGTIALSAGLVTPHETASHPSRDGQSPRSGAHTRRPDTPHETASHPAVGPARNG